jgi:glyoxylase-like metal-dependent hydrolase (beta-lactamase superfamily II)/rhodanese-related sulfurtransferase
MRTITTLLALAGLLPTAAAQDAEQATHNATSSKPQVSFERIGDGWSLRQYQLGCLSHLSYLIVAGDAAAVIDPQRDVDHYVADAKALGAKIRHVLLTHPHADFVAGHTELAASEGATIHVSELAAAAFPHRALHDGDRVTFGPVTLEAWATPGHTPNTMTFLVRVPDDPTDPVFALTGDTLFVGSIGRPDLLDVPPAELAVQSFRSLQRLLTLPDQTMVLPAHGAGSLCGAHLSPDTTSTIGRERATNPYLQIKSQATFVANLIAHQPVAPQYFAFNVALNQKGPPLVARSETLPERLAATDLRARLGQDGWLVDLRDQHSYAAGHLEGSINVALRGRLDTWTGIVVPFAAPLFLVGDDAAVREGVFRLRRIGYDRIAGCVAPDVQAWRAAGLSVRTSKLVAPRELFAQMQAGREPLIVDVRSPDEYADLRLGEVGNIPVTESERFARALAADQPVVMVCNSAYRSSMAVGLAERHGLRDVASLDGGLDAWLTAGLPTVGRQTAASTGTNAAQNLVLPEPVDARLLARVLLEQPQNYTVFDLRPAWQFAEWHLPSAQPIALEQLAARVASLPQTQRVVLVDRDGTVAFAAAGALLAHRPERAIRVLLGGCQAYYREIVLGAAADLPAPGAPAATSVAPPRPAAAPAAPAPTGKPKPRSAGC